MPLTVLGEGYREFSEPRFFECGAQSEVEQIENPVDKAFAFYAKSDGSADFQLWKFDASSTAAAGESVIVPLNPLYATTGRWIKIPVGGGGGSGVWTEDASGVYITDQPTGVVLNPAVADGSSAVAFEFNSNNSLSSFGAKLLTIGNGGANRTGVSRLGGFIVGEATDDWYGDISGAALVSVRSVARGDPNSAFNTLWIESTDENSLDSNFSVNTSTSQLQLQAYVNGTRRILLEPTLSDGNTSYLFDTSISHTSGNLMEVKNNGAKQSQLDYDGNLTIGDGNGTPKFLANGVAGSASISSLGVLRLLPSSSLKTYLNPPAVDGDTAYTFDTSITHTSGNLVDVLNNGTAKFSVDYRGAIVVGSSPPANAASAGVAGTITWDSGFVYVCVAANTWKRAAIATW